MPQFATLLWRTLVFVSAVPIFCQTATQIEPNAGSWKTWVISSGKDFRVPPPPDAGSTLAELAWLKTCSLLMSESAGFAFSEFLPIPDYALIIRRKVRCVWLGDGICL